MFEQLLNGEIDASTFIILCIITVLLGVATFSIRKGLKLVEQLFTRVRELENHRIGDRKDIDENTEDIKELRAHGGGPKLMT